MREGAGGREKIPGENERVREREREAGEPDGAAAEDGMKN